MNLTAVIVSIISGIITGYLYGLSFIHQRRRVFILPNTLSKKALLKHTFINFLLFTLRITILLVVWYYLLQLPLIIFILMLPTFLLTFWMVIFNIKA